jgi:hypothetical protein
MLKGGADIDARLFLRVWRTRTKLASPEYKEIVKEVVKKTPNMNSSLALIFYAARSLTSVEVEDRAQCAQQKK